MNGAPVTIATTVEEVEALRPVWQRMTVTDIDSDIDYFLSVVRSGQDVRPYVLRVCCDGRDMLVVARIQPVSLPLKIGYRKLASVELRAIVVTFGGMMGTRNRADAKQLLRHLQLPLSTGQADIILIRNVDADGTAYEAACGLTWLRRSHWQIVDRRWIADLPDSLAGLLEGRSAKSRSAIRREERLLLKQFGTQLHLELYARPEQVERLCNDMQRVSARTYQFGLGAGYSDSPMQRALVAHGLAKGIYRCWMVYVNDRPIAFWAGMSHGGTFYLATPGFDPEFERHSIGRYTMFRMFEDLCSDPVVRKVDFGRGDAQYKAEYSAEAGRLTDIWVAARRPWPILMVCALSMFSFANSVGKTCIARLRWSARLKSHWRRRLAGVARDAGLRASAR